MDKGKCIIFGIGILISLAYAAEDTQAVADFIAGVISDSRQKNLGRDVAVLNINSNPKDNLHKDTLDVIIAEVSKSNVVLLPNQKVLDQRSGAVSFVVIVSDVNNLVSYLCEFEYY